jgi:hypothetical protein
MMAYYFRRQLIQHADNFGEHSQAAEQALLLTQPVAFLQSYHTAS